MPLAIGQSLGNYQIAGPLGKGGMGEVYRAKDTKLGREVAIKVLPAAFALHPERLARFEREAKVLASLNHPNIATIYAVEESPAGKALVMELVEGDTLKGPVDLDTALKYAAQIASALEAAHEKGITHRDLKPANIMLTRDGVIKVLDFGLAAVTQPSGDTEDGTAATLTMSPTQAGTILGTAPYMSPEQASGKVVDRRTDIWAFGVVLWEVLTGKRLFVGDTIAHTLAAVLKDEPDWTQVPARVRRLLQACLAKDVKQRLQSIADWRHLLTEETAAVPQVIAPASKLPWIAAAAMTLLAAVALWGWLKPVPVEPRQLTHFLTAAPQGIGSHPIAVSRDGSRIAFPGARDGAPIYVRTLDQPEAKPVPGTEGGGFPAFSPDGQWLAFFAGAPAQLKKVPVAGGAALTLATDLPGTGPMGWGDDDQILVMGGGDLRRIPAAGGEPVVVAKPDPGKGELGFAAPGILPGGKYILVNVLTPKGLADFRVIALNPQTGEKKTLLDGVGVTWFAASGTQPGIGHLVYGRNGALFGAPFNANTLQAGSPVPLLEGVSAVAGLSVFGVSRGGTLAYAAGGMARLAVSIPTWVDRQGMETLLGVPTRNYLSPRISPDGGRVAFQIIDFSKNVDIQLWVHDVTRGTTTRVTFDRSSANPVWTPDGKRLLYVSGVIADPNGTLLSVAADGSGQPVTLLSEGFLPAPQTVSPDGKMVMGIHSTNIGADNPASGNEIWTLPLNGEGKAADAKPQPFLDTRFTRGNFRFSPDGKWLAFESNDTGRNEVYVVPYPGPGGKSQISTDGGTQPRWNHSGRELFFRNGDKMMAVDVETGAAFRAGAPYMLFEKAANDYDVAPDGRRFLMLKPPAAGPGGAGSELHVILNWFEDLRRKVPLGK
jgi:Tol biopolymer transport system component